MRKQVLNGQNLLIDDRIENYIVHQKQSSNIDYFGLDLAGRKMFIQFKNGGSYIYNDVDDHTMENSLKAESIGRYLSANVIGKFTSVKVEGSLVTLEVEDTTEWQSISDQQAESRLNRNSQNINITRFDIDSEPGF